MLFLSVTTEQVNGGEHDRANDTPLKRQTYLLELESIMLILPILETLKSFVVRHFLQIET